MTEAENTIKFVLSTRGRYIIGQALTYAIQEMSEVAEDRREYSNIADMEYLLENFVFEIENGD